MFFFLYLAENEKKIKKTTCQTIDLNSDIVFIVQNREIITKIGTLFDRNHI